ncbi:hypothetical protein N9N97_02745 [Rickettsiaceae bacterium]|nr:hypothetical protein [Rickettsiaceae bacterium]
MGKNIGHQILNFLEAALVRAGAAFETLVDTLVDLGAAVLNSFISKNVESEILSEVLQSGVNDLAEAVTDVDLTTIIEDNFSSKQPEELELVGAELVVSE